MTPIFFNSSYPMSDDHHYEEELDHQHHHQLLTFNNSQPSSSSNSSTSLIATHQQLFLNSNHQNGNVINFNHPAPQHQQHDQGDNYGSKAYNDHRIENCNGKGAVEFSTWNNSNDLNQVKWMSSKMRVMLKMKKPNPNTNYTSTTRDEEVTKLEDHRHHRLPTSPMEETENSSNTTSSNTNIPIRVCSDCNTTKTPLWRSGPRGPKSLCNACGIRQRKARRAMAAAAAAERGNSGSSTIFMDQSTMAPLKVTKTQHKDHKKTISKGHVTKYKKRQYSKQMITTRITPPPPLMSSSPSPSPSPSPSSSPSSSPPSSSSNPARRNCVEEFLVSLSKNLTFYHVFPQDEKEAAILLMALSCGYAAHET